MLQGWRGRDAVGDPAASASGLLEKSAVTCTAREVCAQGGGAGEQQQRQRENDHEGVPGAGSFSDLELDEHHERCHAQQRGHTGEPGDDHEWHRASGALDRLLGGAMSGVARCQERRPALSGELFDEPLLVGRVPARRGGADRAQVRAEPCGQRRGVLARHEIGTLRRGPAELQKDGPDCGAVPTRVGCSARRGHGISLPGP